MLHTGSCECSTGSTDLFTAPPTQTSVLKRTTVDLYPTGNTTDDGPIDLLAPASDEEYTGVEHTLELEVKIVKANGNDLAAEDVVGFVNCPLHAMFSQVDVWISETLVTNSSNTYPYLAYLEKILTYDEHTLESQFTAELIDMDTEAQFNDLTANEGFVNRKEYTAASKSVVLRGSLHVPILRQDKYLLNKCDLRIKLTPNNRRFYLMAAADNFKVKIVRARLEIMKVKLSPQVVLEHNRELQNKNAIYPIHRGVIKTFSIPTGSMHIIRENLFTGRLPRRLVIGLVDSAAFSGSITKNPFNFEHFNLNYICAYVDGVRYPNRALTPDFANDDYIEALQSIYNGTGIRNDNQASVINRDNFDKGFAIYAIHLGAADPDSLAYDLIQKGQVRVEMKFKEALTKNVTAIVYSEFEDMLEINRDRAVFVDY